MDTLRHRHPPASLRFLLKGILSAELCVAGGLLIFPAPTALSSSRGNGAPGQLFPHVSWAPTLTPPARPAFPAITPFHATYRFGWEGIPAGGAEVHVSEGNGGARRRIAAVGGPNELIRKLWNYHCFYVGEAGADGQAPSWFRMDEEVARGDLISEGFFTENLAVSRHQFVTESKPWKNTPLPGVRDLFAAMLCVRSQPVRVGDRVRLNVFPDQNPYLVDLRAEGRDTLTIGGRKVPAVRFSVGVQAIATQDSEYGKLSPHKKFRSGRVWMSDDARRLPLRAEVDVFIGSVFAELVKITPPL